MEPLASTATAMLPEIVGGQLRRAVLLTLLYSDLFDFPLDEAELYRFLVAPCDSPEQLRHALAELEAEDRVSRVDSWWFLAGSEANIELRQQRQQLAARRWPPARRFGRWLSWVPFLRMVGVCGSQAVENGGADGDVDLVLITAPRRLWIAQATVMLLRRLGGLLGIEICPNFLLSADQLVLQNRNLYVAREVAQVVPLWGEDAYQDFLAANRWIHTFLPQIANGDRQRFLEPRPQHLATRWVEKLLGGRLGTLLDGAIHRLSLTYYALRLRRHGWSRQEIEQAYRPERQTVMRGGFLGAVRRRFLDRAAELLDDEDVLPEATALFESGALDDADPLYANLFTSRYGSADPPR